MLAADGKGEESFLKGDSRKLGVGQYSCRKEKEQGGWRGEGSCE